MARRLAQWRPLVVGAMSMEDAITMALRLVLAIGFFAGIAVAEHSPPKVCCQTLLTTGNLRQLVVTCHQTGQGKPPTELVAYCPNIVGDPTSAYLVDDCATKCPVGVYPERRRR